jgi:hypothetical protein
MRFDRQFHRSLDRLIKLKMLGSSQETPANLEETEK